MNTQKLDIVRNTNLRNDTYQVVTIDDESGCINGVLFQGRFADCEAYMQLEEVIRGGRSIKENSS
jgi:hypothetical protein